MATLPQLADPEAYRACEVDLVADASARAYWLNLFESHLDVQLSAAGALGVPAASLQAARRTFDAVIDTIRTDAEAGRLDRLDILRLDDARRETLHAHGIVNEFRAAKQRENAAALALLASHLAWIDQAESAEQRLERVVRGMLAGNMFDMGAPEVTAAIERGELSFEAALAQLPERPWRFDDLDAAGAWLDGRSDLQAVIFCDNAGGDAILGVLPLARLFAQQGGGVIIAANSAPSLNDITADEFRAVLNQAEATGAVFRSAQVQVVPSGCIAPLIDLTDITQELADACTGADLIVLVGMGRSIESNWSARFTCPCWRVAMIKDPQVARTVDAQVYDAVFRVDEPA
jgi:uncharacterized protein with ATP-grasp and redox domains